MRRVYLDRLAERHTTAPSYVSASNGSGSLVPTRPPPKPNSASIGFDKSHLSPRKNENVGGEGNGGNLKLKLKLNTGGNLKPQIDAPLGLGSNENEASTAACALGLGASGGGGNPMR